jgi:hypothetical protein
MRQQYHSRLVDGKRLIWDVNKLVGLAATLPRLAIRIDEISEFDEGWWFEGQAGAVTPRQVAEHAKLMSEVDLAFPIILCSEGRLMDGMHRVAKAWMLGHATIDAVRFSTDPVHDYVDVDLDSLPYPAGR